MDTKRDGTNSSGLTEETGGLLVRSDSTHHDGRPSQKPSVLGLDRLAAQKRAEQTTDLHGKTPSHPSSLIDTALSLQ